MIQKRQNRPKIAALTYSCSARSRATQTCSLAHCSNRPLSSACRVSPNKICALLRPDGIMEHHYLRPTLINDYSHQGGACPRPGKVKRRQKPLDNSQDLGYY